MNSEDAGKTTKAPVNLCLTCVLADWKRTSAGRLHPSGDGRCLWKPPYIPTPTAWRWNTSRGETGRPDQPVPSWGYLERSRPIAECETYEVKKDG